MVSQSRPDFLVDLVDGLVADGLVGRRIAVGRRIVAASRRLVEGSCRSSWGAAARMFWFPSRRRSGVAGDGGSAFGWRACLFGRHRVLAAAGQSQRSDKHGHSQTLQCRMQMQNAWLSFCVLHSAFRILFLPTVHVASPSVQRTPIRSLARGRDPSRARLRRQARLPGRICRMNHLLRW